MEEEAVPLHPAHAGLPLAEYLALLWPDVPRRALLELFRAGRLRSQGRPVAQARRIGELADLALVGGSASIPRIFRGPLDGSLERLGAGILHEDARFLVVSKPAGIPVVPDRDKADGSLLGAAVTLELSRRAGADPAAFRRPRVVHRIDRWTSGVVILARTAEAERRLAADFEKRRVVKRYLALLDGDVRPGRITVHCPVVEGRKGRMRAELRERGPLDQATGAALTRFDVLERRPGEGRTLVEASPRTGRTHQIRVHAWAIGHPVAGDPLYGPGGGGGRPHASGPPRDAPSMRLHAWRYELPADWEEPRSFACEPDEALRPRG
jgi:RluA family pseudouridine synthase